MPEDHQAGLPGLAGQLGAEAGGEGGTGGQGGQGGQGGEGKRGRRGEKGEKGDTPETDEFFMQKPLWLGLKRWTWVKVAFFGMMFMGVYSLWLVDQNSKADRDNRDDIILEAVSTTDFRNCLERNELRESLRSLVIVATEGGGGTDLTNVPGFADLDAAMQQFLINLSALSDSESDDGENPQRERLLATIVDENCEETATTVVNE